MKKFLISVIALSTTIIALILCLFAAKHQDHYDIPLDRNILVMGDSHTECSVDDEIVDRAINLSNGAEPYICTYIGLRSVLEGENSIDTLILSFWRESLIAHSDKFDPAWQNNLNNKILHIRGEDISDISLDPVFYFRPIFFALLDGQYNSLGAFHHNPHHKLKEDIVRKQLELSQGDDPQPMIEKSGMQYKYLCKIRDLCRENDVKLLLFSAPTYEADKFYEQDEFERELRKNLKGFSDFEIPNDGFCDVGHLNYDGAKIFSRHLQDEGITDGAEYLSL